MAVKEMIYTASSSHRPFLRTSELLLKRVKRSNSFAAKCTNGPFPCGCATGQGVGMREALVQALQNNEKDSVALQKTISRTMEQSPAGSYCSVLCLQALHKQNVSSRVFNKKLSQVVQNRILETQRILVAYHEAGHVVVSAKLLHTNIDKLHEMKLLRHSDLMGGTIGSTQWKRSVSRVHSLEHILDRVCVSLAGGASEGEFFGLQSLGGTDDVRHAIQTLNQCNILGLLLRPIHGKTYKSTPFAESLHTVVVDDLKELHPDVLGALRDSAAKATALISIYRSQVHQVAQACLEKGVLTGSCVETILTGT